MRAETDNEHDGSLDGQANALNGFADDISGSLIETIETDARLQSGVPGDKRVGDLDFIQMTGLTRPGTSMHPQAPAAPPASEDLDPSRPVSFFETGVRDVDHTLSPGAIETPPALRADGLSDSTRLAAPSTSAAALKKIVAELAESPGLFPDAGHEIQAEYAVAEPEPVPETPPAAAAEESSSLDETLSQLLSQLQAAESASPPALHEIAAPDTTDGTRGAANADRRLAEAEQLLQELEQQPRDSSADFFSESTAPPLRKYRFEWQDPGPPSEEPDPEAESERRIVYDYSAAPGRRRITRHQLSRQRRRFIRISLAALAVLAACAGAYLAYHYYINPAIMTPEEMIALAANQTAGCDFQKASQTYQWFVKRYPEHPFRPEAEFAAAWSLRAVPVTGPTAELLRKEALDLFARFVQNNPADPRRARAESVMGIIQYELGQYEQAINSLRDPARLAQDPSAALPMLRALAGAYRQINDFEHAESAYLQAAVHPRNYSSDADYFELGDLAAQRAKSVEDKTERAKFQASALDYWNRATHVSGIDPSVREEIQKHIDRLKTETGLTFAAAPEAPAAAAPAPPETAAVPAEEHSGATPVEETAPTQQHKADSES